MTLDQATKDWLSDTLGKIECKMKCVRERSQNKIPAIAINGIHDDRSDQQISWEINNGINWWTNGFWGGMLWQMYYFTKDERYAEIAAASEKKLDRCFEMYYGLHHDVGFMWMPTAVASYRLTGNPESRKRGLLAAQLLAGRFNPAGKYIRAWNDNGNADSNRGWAIIDCMFNITLLYWASKELNDPRYQEIAMMHADTVIQNFIRENGSVKHIVEFDPFTGERIRDYGGQGYAQGSSWTRGQGWALYGFVLSYQHTGKELYLETATRVADYFISSIPEDGHIPIDFDQPAEPHFEDSTAAAIAACGLIELAAYKTDTDVYLQAALKLLKTLTKDRCDFSAETDGILLRCSGSYHSQHDRETNLIYADYYLLEALLKLNGTKFNIW